MKNIKVSDHLLIANYLNGDESSFEALLLKYKDRVFTQLYLMVKDRDLAEDLFQETFIKVVNTLKLGKYNHEGKFLPWVKRIAHNLAIDHFRKLKKLNEVHNHDEYDLMANIPDDGLNIEETMVSEQILGSLEGLVDELPHEQREVIKMRIYMGLSFKEIADETDVSINTSLGRMRYALINLRKLINDKNLNLKVS
jgi:RNA polymerase sigma-70 factor (ECF subfamily)